MRTALGVIVIFSLLLVSLPANADRISGVAATTPDMGAGFGTILDNTVNGAGLSAVTLTATHAATLPSNSWVSTAGILTGHVVFNLGGSFTVDRFSFWNQNGGGPGAAGSTGIHSVVIDISADGLVFLPLVGGPSSFAQVLGSNVGPETFSFAPVQASFFRFDILSNYGDTRQTGFAEVGFNAVTTVPEPTTLLLLASGLIGVATRFRRMR